MPMVERRSDATYAPLQRGWYALLIGSIIRWIRRSTMVLDAFSLRQGTVGVCSDGARLGVSTVWWKADCQARLPWCCQA